MSAQTNRAAPGPFLKWAGGKTQLLPTLSPFFPHDIPRYIEPFVGSGAVFFYLRGERRLTGTVILADINEELVNAYLVVRDDVEALISRLETHRAAHGREHYYRVREEGFEPGARGAARTIYLNKTGYNGLYRVNSKGAFNVPMGRYRNPGIFDADALRAASRALQGVDIRRSPFEETIAAAPAGTMLYLDPPYAPVSQTARFTDYIPGGFGPDHQERLAACVREADRRGVRFLLSNSCTDSILKLYAGFRVVRVPARRNINSRADRRGEVFEVIVTNIAIP